MIGITFNYRLNVIGFLCLEALTNISSTKASGNYGLIDMIIALQWIQENIESFGGNKNLITIYGQSSGGTAINCLLASPLAKGLFHRVISESSSPQINRPLSITQQENLVIVNNTSCRDLIGGSSNDLVNCLRSLNASELVLAVPWFLFYLIY